MKNTDENMKKYLKLSQEFAIKQLVEKWVFEIKINQELFASTPSLLDLINDSHSTINLSYEEYEKMYNNIINNKIL